MSSEVVFHTVDLGLTNLPTFVWVIPALLLASVYTHYQRDNYEGHPQNQRNLLKKYDFIVIGAGSAGAVVASRLSENPRDSVLLLEAGGDENEISDVPSLAGYLQLSQMDWKYKTEPQDNACLAMAGRRCNWPRGKVMGGSSVLNYMLYVRGNKKDYDNWENAGNPGWGFKDVLYYFRKSEDNKNTHLARNRKYHGVGGYLTVSEAPWRTPLAMAFVKAGTEMGIKNRDYNARYQTGFMIPQGTIRRGTRCSTSKAFLRPVSKRKNFHIGMHSFVTKILIDERTRRAVGVELIRNKKTYTVFANKEIILSAGSINTAQLLMLSGIGPKAHLESHGIKVIQDLPVGQNMQDHIAMGGLVFLIDKQVSMVQPRYENMYSALKYSLLGRGPLTILGGVEGLGFIHTKFINSSLDFPDIEYHFVSGSPSSDGGKMFRKIQGLTEETWIKMFRPIAFKDCFNIFPMLLRPESVGNITLRSKNPFHKPLINPNYLTKQRDVDTLVEGAKLAIALSNTKAFQKFGARLYTEPIPGCERYNVPSEEYLACLAKHYTATIYHPVGTAKMGPRSDPEAVVDPELKVYGISSLRVIDGSIMPKIVSGNTNAPIIMIGEKGADLIKKYWYGAKR